jgi:hypothetical protein
MLSYPLDRGMRHKEYSVASIRRTRRLLQRYILFSNAVFGFIIYSLFRWLT